jgi:hypothetical protein
MKRAPLEERMLGVALCPCVAINLEPPQHLIRDTEVGDNSQGKENS